MDWTSLTGSTTTVGSLARWLNTSTLSAGTDGDADSILQEAVGWISSELTHWRSMTSATGTMTIASDAVTFPSDFDEANIFYITGVNSSKMTMKTPQDVIAAWAYDGNGVRIQQQPTIYYVDKDMLRMDSPADQAYPYVLIYYSQIPALSESDPTNFLTIYYPRLVRCACMMHAAEWAKDNGMGAYDRTYWEQLAQQALDSAQADSDRSRRATEFAAQIVGGGADGPFPAFSGW